MPKTQILNRGGGRAKKSPWWNGKRDRGFRLLFRLRDRWWWTVERSLVVDGGAIAVVDCGAIADGGWISDRWWWMESIFT